MEHRIFLTLLAAAAALSVVIEGSLADPLPEPERLLDIPKTPSPFLPPPAPILPPTPPAPILPPVPILPPLPAPLPQPPLPALSPYAPIPMPPDMPCYPALLECKNTSTSDPSEICCDNLKAVYENGTDCICKVVESLELSQELGLNNTDVSTLLVECKITKTSTSICTDPVTSTSPPPPPNGASFRAEWIGFFTLFSLLLFIMA